MNNANTQLDISGQSLTLYRYPIRQGDKLQAWDAADEYLLQEVETQLPELGTTASTLIINDNFGTLSCALHKLRPTSISDSWLGLQAASQNFEANNIDPENVDLRNSLDWPSQTSFDLVILKIPKSLALLEDQLHRLKPLVTESSVVIAAAMAKHVHTSTLNLFKKILGETKTSLAKKKARLVLCAPKDSLIKSSTDVNSPYPKSYQLDELNLTIANHAGVFSQQKLDIGTRFFLEHLPKDLGAKHIVDLGCGNGLLGLVAAKQNKDINVSFYDESFMAVKSAEINFKSALGHTDKASFIQTDCLSGVDDSSADIVFNNPPFHQQHAIGDFIAKQMFNDAKRVLRKNGELWIVGNRHLGYHKILDRLFGNHSIIASNKKFVILRAIKK